MSEAPQNWYVMVEHQTYGPYSTAQMEAFVKEGRIIGDSIISHDTTQGFYRASAYPIFSKWSNVNPQAAVQEQRVSAQEAVQQTASADAQQNVLQLQMAVGQSHTTPAQTYELEAQHIVNTQIDPSVFVIMAEIQSGQAMRFLQRLQTLGTAQRIGDTVWLLRAASTVGALRSSLSQTLGNTDRLFIVDTFRNDKAWFNIGADMGGRIDDLWDG